MKIELEYWAFNNYVDRILPLRGQVLYPERGQKQTFFDPLPPHPRSYWMALNKIDIYNMINICFTAQFL